MTDLVAMLSIGKGTWAEVSWLIKAENWENIYLIANLFGAQKFTADRKINFVVIDPDADILQIRQKIYDGLKDKVKTEIALNMASGTGREHAALMSAAMRLGVGIRLVSISENKMIEV